MRGPPLELCRRTPGVVAVGWVPSVLPYLRRAKVSLAPLRYGAGTKRKLIQAMMVGTPTVASPVAVEGIDIGNQALVRVADGPVAFADALTTLLADGLEHEPSVTGRIGSVTDVHGREHAAGRFRAAVATVIEKRLPSHSGG